jgi:hypothetical protein
VKKIEISIRKNDKFRIDQVTSLNDVLEDLCIGELTVGTGINAISINHFPTLWISVKFLEIFFATSIFNSASECKFLIQHPSDDVVFKLSLGDGFFDIKNIFFDGSNHETNVRFDTGVARYTVSNILNFFASNRTPGAQLLLSESIFLETLLAKGRVSL